jgi:hypothetical protein
MKLVATLIGLFVTGPIWFYLIYSILLRVNASELMWFLYWVYVPVGMFVATLNRIVESEK